MMRLLNQVDDINFEAVGGSSILLMESGNGVLQVDEIIRKENYLKILHVAFK